MKKRYFTLLALLLSAGLAAPACGGDDDDDDNQQQDDDDDGTQGAGGGNQQGSGGGNNQGSGGGNNQGSGGGGNQGNAGSSGTGGGGNVPDLTPGSLTIGGANVDDTKGVFPFAVAVAGDGSIFVSTLGNRNVNNGDEPSRIYRFNKGETTPEVLFEAGIDAGVYGLTFLKGNLYACISQHVLSANNVVSSIYEITSGQLDDTDLTKADVQQFDLQSTVVNVNGAFQVQAEEVAGRCGQITNDGTAIYAPDVLDSGFIFRVNPANVEDEGDSGEDGIYNNQELAPIKTTAWFQDDALINNNNAAFGTTAVNVNGNLLQFFLNNDGTQIFGVQLSDGGLKPEVNTLDNAEVDTLDDVIGQPFGLAVDPQDNERYVATDQNADELLVLTRNNNGNYDTSRIFSAINNDDTFIEPGAVVTVGNKAVVVATQIGQLAAGEHDEDAKIFIVQY